MPAEKFYFVSQKGATLGERLGGLNWTAFAAELGKIKNGEKAYLEIHRKGKPKSPEELGYYYAVILPEAFKTLKESGELSITISARDKAYELPLDENTTDIFLKWRYGKWHGEYKDKGDMNMAECAFFMDWCITWLAIHYNCHIPPADPNWKEKKDEA